MAAPAKTLYSEAEYLALDRATEFKSEYHDGEIVAMTGGTEAHNLIVANLVFALKSQLQGRGCKVYPSDMRVKIPARRRYLFPDVSIVCGISELEDDTQDTLLNPGVIIEVLSRTTEAYDRGRKFEYYQTLDSVTDYVLVSQVGPRVEHFARQLDGKWLLTVATGLDGEVDIPSIQCSLRLDVVYDLVGLPKAGE